MTKYLAKTLMMVGLLALPAFAHDEDGAEEREGALLSITHTPKKGSNEEAGFLSVESPFTDGDLKALANFRDRYPRVQLGLDQIAEALYGQPAPVLQELLKDKNLDWIQVDLNFDRPFYEASNQTGFENANLKVLVKINEWIGESTAPFVVPLDELVFENLLIEAAAKARKKQADHDEIIRQAEIRKKQEDEARVRFEERLKTERFFKLLPKL